MQNVFVELKTIIKIATSKTIEIAL